MKMKLLATGVFGYVVMVTIWICYSAILAAP